MTVVDGKFRKKRLQILRSAAAVFHRRGYHGATVDAIARALNMTKGNLYYYFRDKEEMLFVCHDYSLDMLLQMLASVQASALPPAEKLHEVIAGFVRITIRDLRGTTLLLDVEGLVPRHRREIVRKRDRFDHGIREIIQDGMNDGTFCKGDAKLTTFAILGALNWTSRWFNSRGPATYADITEAFVKYLIAGLRARRSLRTPPVRASARVATRRAREATRQAQQLPVKVLSAAPGC